MIIAIMLLCIIQGHVEVRTTLPGEVDPNRLKTTGVTTSTQLSIDVRIS